MVFEVGDRVVLSNDPGKLKADFLNRTGTVAYVESTEEWCRVVLDRKSNPVDEPRGWKIQYTSMSLMDVSDVEVAAMFAVPPEAPDVPGPDSEQIALLEHIDTALRSGTRMTRANLAFEFLLQQLGHTRLDLPSYVRDMQRSEK